MMKTKLYSSLSLLLVLSMGISSCKKVTAGASSTTATTSSTSTSYTCLTASNNARYNNLLSCQLTTNANCTGAVETFPNGVSATCYSPAAGWESCASATPTWQYTAYTVNAITTGGYLLKRSLIGCSSAVCLCSPASTAADLETVIAALPVTCNTTTCAPYIYQGTMGITGLPFTIWTDPTVTVAVPSVSAETTPEIKVTGAPNGFTLKIYTDSACSIATLQGSAVVAGGTAQVSANVTGGGVKNFYATFTNAGNTTSCVNTGVSYHQLVMPVLSQPSRVVIPSTANPAGSIVTLNFSAPDNTGTTYTCMYDTTVDGTAGVTNCTALGVSFNTATGYLTWTPSAVLNAKYEFCVTATNLAGTTPVPTCVGVYLINSTSYTLKDPSAVNIPATSTQTSVVVGAVGGTGASEAGFKYYLYSDSACSTSLASSVLAGGSDTYSLTMTGYGTKTFYGKFQDPVSLTYTNCINTGKSYYLLGTPVLTQPTSLIYPNYQLKTGVSGSLNFQAVDPTGVTYTCKFDRVVDNTTAGGSDCATLLTGGSFNTSTGVLTWTPPTSAYGPYEFCVIGTQAASPNPTDSKCAVIDVVPNTLITTGLASYYDANFALPNGGQNSNSDASKTVWSDLIGALHGALTNVIWTGGSGWNNWSWPTYPYVFDANSDSGNDPSMGPPYATYYFSPGQMHDDYANLGAHTNSAQSITVEQWMYVRGQPVTDTTDWNNIPGPGWQFFTHPIYTGTGHAFNLYNGSDEGLKLQVQHSTGGGWVGTYRFVAYVKASAAGGGDIYCYSTNSFSYNSQYHHVTTVWDQSTLDLRLYVDGTLECTRGLSGNTGFMGAGTPTSVALPIISRSTIMGCDSTANRKFVGQIAKTRIYNSANPAIPATNCSAERQQFGLGAMPGCP